MLDGLEALAGGEREILGGDVILPIDKGHGARATTRLRQGANEGPQRRVSRQAGRRWRARSPARGYTRTTRGIGASAGARDRGDTGTATTIRPGTTRGIRPPVGARDRSDPGAAKTSACSGTGSSGTRACSVRSRPNPRNPSILQHRRQGKHPPASPRGPHPLSSLSRHKGQSLLVPNHLPT